MVRKKYLYHFPNLKPEEYGMVVYVGKEVTTEDFFAKIVDSGAKILPSVDHQISQIEKYFDNLSKLKIGDIVKLMFNTDGIIEMQKERVIQKNKTPHKKPQ